MSRFAILGILALLVSAPAGAQQTDLISVVRAGTVEALTAALSRGAAVDQRSADGTTPLIMAAALGKAEHVRVLLDANADAAAATAQGITALMVGAAVLPPADLQRLVQRGATPTAADGLGRTAMTFAATGNNADGIRYLASLGLSPNGRSGPFGNTDLHSAVIIGAIDSARALIAAGANPQARNAIGQTPADLCALPQRPGLCELLNRR